MVKFVPKYNFFQLSFWFICCLNILTQWTYSGPVSFTLHEVLLWHKFPLIFFIPSAPQVSPGKFKGFNTSSTSIALRWDPIPKQNVAGVLRNFYVTYRELNTDDNTTHTIAVPLSNLSFVLTNLRKYTNYSLEIKGATKFLGRPTEPIIITTDEDGNAIFCLFTCLFKEMK